jgi:hypothetical protein
MNKQVLSAETEALAMRAATLGDLIRFPNDKLVSEDEIDVVKAYARVAESINRLRRYIDYLPENEES